MSATPNKTNQNMISGVNHEKKKVRVFLRFNLAETLLSKD